jgi:hypothetical protein
VLEKDEDKARDELLLSRALRFPGPDILNKQAEMNKKVINLTFNKNAATVKNIVRAAEILKQSNTHDLDLNMLRDSYTKADWSFSKASNLQFKFDRICDLISHSVF